MINYTKGFNKSILLFFSFILLILSCNNVNQKKTKIKYEDPYEYYNTLNNKYNSVKNLIFDIQSKKTSEESRELIHILKKDLINGLNTYYSMMLDKNDYGLKNTYLNYMKFYEKQGLKYIIQLIDIKQEIEILKNNNLEVLQSLDNEYKEVNKILSIKEKEISKDIEKIKHIYFKKYNILDENTK